jgi:hypothetical protein
MKCHFRVPHRLKGPRLPLYSISPYCKDSEYNTKHQTDDYVKNETNDWRIAPHHAGDHRKHLLWNTNPNWMSLTVYNLSAIHMQYLP